MVGFGMFQLTIDAQIAASERRKWTVYRISYITSFQLVS